MVIETEQFQRKRTDEERSADSSQVIAIRFNKDDLLRVEAAARLLSQERVSTVVKQLVELGLLCLQDQKTVLALKIQRENNRRNWRIGIVEAEPRFTQS
jgi:hypothetical protein